MKNVQLKMENIENLASLLEKAETPFERYHEALILKLDDEVTLTVTYSVDLEDYNVYNSTIQNGITPFLRSYDAERIAMRLEQITKDFKEDSENVKRLSKKFGRMYLQ